MANLDIAALRKLYSAAAWPETKRGGMVPMSHDTKALFHALVPVLPALLDAAEERDRLRAQRDALLAALEPIVWQLESAQRSTAPAFFKGFAMNDTESGALLRAIAAAKKETP